MTAEPKNAQERWGVSYKDWSQDQEEYDAWCSSTWLRQPGDFEAVISDFDAGVQPPPPAFGHRDDGRALFYAGEVNLIFGDHSSAKSWLMLYTVKQAIEAGHKVLYIDFEDSARKAGYRLLQMGTDRTAIVENLLHIHPKAKFTNAEANMIHSVVLNNDVQLAVIDTVGVAVGRQGGDSNKDSDLAQWLDEFPNLIATWGPAVVLVDHTAMSIQDPKKPGGSGRKMQSISGAAYSVLRKASFGKGKVGKSLLVCQKDRNGDWAIGDKAALFTLDATGPNPDREVKVSLTTPPEKTSAEEAVEHGNDQDRADQEALDALVDALEDAGADLNITVRAARDLLGVRTERAQEAVRARKQRAQAAKLFN